jgi:CDP-6-deoxy-D-xylo-4-hexulose-3-dehydrase
MRNVPVSGAVITEEDIQAVIETAKKGWFTEGDKSKEFARQLAKYIGTRHAVLCNSGSSANLLALTALISQYRNTSNPTYVVTCATGFPTTVSPIVQNGCIPLFIDANPNTLNPDTNTVLEVLQRGDVIGVILAHTLGFPYDAKKIREECDKLNKFLIETSF